VKYYLTAMLFIVFDIEIVFLYPWAWRSTRSASSAGRDGPVHPHAARRLRLRLASRRARVGLTRVPTEGRWPLMGIEEKLPSGVLLTSVEKLAGYMRKGSSVAGDLRSLPAAPSR
jgi:hypothetical protein